MFILKWFTLVLLNKLRDPFPEFGFGYLWVRDPLQIAKGPPTKKKKSRIIIFSD
jgi:hypothetical protein